MPDYTDGTTLTGLYRGDIREYNKESGKITVRKNSSASINFELAENVKIFSVKRDDRNINAFVDAASFSLTEEIKASNSAGDQSSLFGMDGS